MSGTTFLLYAYLVKAIKSPLSALLAGFVYTLTPTDFAIGPLYKALKTKTTRTSLTDTQLDSYGPNLQLHHLSS